MFVLVYGGCQGGDGLVLGGDVVRPWAGATGLWHRRRPLLPPYDAPPGVLRFLTLDISLPLAQFRFCFSCLEANRIMLIALLTPLSKQIHNFVRKHVCAFLAVLC